MVESHPLRDVTENVGVMADWRGYEKHGASYPCPYHTTTHIRGHDMENTGWKHEITFSTSTDAEAKANKESVKSTTTIIFKDWNLADLIEYAATTVKINQIQPKIRLGEVIGSEFIASRPGTKPSRIVRTPMSRLIYALGEEKAKKAVATFGTPEAALKALESLIG